jgi:hypothetical protein
MILETMNEQVLQEVAKGPQELPDDVYIRVMHPIEDKNYITVLFTDKDGNDIPPVDDNGEDNLIYGDVTFALKNTEYEEFKCDDAAVIVVTEVADGWGPFLYDITMEIATQRANGLTSDRNIVSDEAQEVWDFYSKNRPDVKQFQMDDESNSLTPEDEDNCEQSRARKDGDWEKSPLSKRYTKKPTILNQIKDKLIWEI